MMYIMYSKFDICKKDSWQVVYLANSTSKVHNILMLCTSLSGIVVLSLYLGLLHWCEYH